MHKLTSISLAASIALLSVARAEPREIKVTPPICETVVVKKVFPGCSKADAMVLGATQKGDAWGCSAAASSGIAYTNGKIQVGSYANAPAMEASRPGDRVRLCLVSKMIDCPPGDDRGKTYTALNLRTHGRWRKPNGSHACGGA